MGRNQKGRLLDGQEMFSAYLEETKRFLHQAGVPFDQVAETARDAVRSASEEWTEGTNSKIILFRAAAAHIPLEAGESEPDGLFRFDEDEQLHRQIGKLPAKNRLPFILMNFHEFNSAETGSICRMTADEAQAAAENGRAMLMENAEDSDVDRQLPLLHRAFGRLQYPEPVDEQEILLEDNEPVTGGPNGRKWWVAGAGFVSLVGLMIAAAFILPAWAGPVNASYIKELESRFEEEKALFQEEIGATDMEMQMFYTVDEAEVEFKAYVKELERSIQDGMAPRKSEADQTVSKILIVFDLPSEMAESLQDRQLTEDLIESRKFIERYYMRNIELMSILQNRVVEYPEQLRAAFRDGAFNEEVFIDGADHYPEALQKSVRLMEEEGFGMWVIEDERYGSTNPMFIEPALGKAASGLEDSVARMADLVERLGPVTGLLEQSPENIAETLIGFEELAITEKEGDHWSLPSDYATNVFNAVVLGGMNVRIFSEEGTVLPERRAIWQEIATYSGTPSGDLMKPIVEEMKETGWKRSPSYNQLTSEEYHFAIMSARDGFERESVQINEQSVYLPEPDFQVRAHTLYQDLSNTGDRSLTEGETQLMIATLALLAADREDKRMMALLSADEDPSSISGLTENGPIDVLEGGSLKFYESLIEPHETGIRSSVVVQTDKGLELEVPLTYTPAGLWLEDRPLPQ